jgi:hypothetical protein
MFLYDLILKLFMVKSEEKFWAREFLILILILILTGSCYVAVFIRNNLYLGEPKVNKYYNLKSKHDDLSYLASYYEDEPESKRLQVILVEIKKNEDLLSQCEKPWKEDLAIDVFKLLMIIVYPIRIGLYVTYHLLVFLFELTKKSIKILFEKE